jgi:hypothetical protein
MTRPEPTSSLRKTCTFRQRIKKLIDTKSIPAPIDTVPKVQITEIRGLRPHPKRTDVFAVNSEKLRRMTTHELETKKAQRGTEATQEAPLRRFQI